MLRNKIVATGAMKKQQVHLRKGDTQYPEKGNVWAGISRNTNIGPLFIAENLTTLRNQIDVACKMILQEDLISFQQGGAEPHYYLPVISQLNDIFSGSWIGKRGAIECPLRSPDLSRLGIILQGYLKSVVHVTQRRVKNFRPKFSGILKGSLSADFMTAQKI